MLFLADEGALEFLEPQGLHALLPHLYLNGNRPEPEASTVLFGLAVGGLYLLLAGALSWRLGRLEVGRSFSTAARVGWRLLLVVGFFLAWELSLQAWTMGNPYEMFIPDPAAFWKANPEYLQDQAQALHRVHSGRRYLAMDGILDPEFPPERTPGTWRLMVLGHSQVLSIQPHRYGGRLTYPKLLPGLGMKGPGGEPLECINAAISGYSSWQGLLLLKNLAPRYRPDVVVCAFSYHDANFAFSTDAEVMTDDPRVHALRAALYRSKVYLLIRRVVLKGKAAWNDRARGSARVPRVTVAQYEANLRAMARLARQYGFRLAFLSEPTRTDRVAEVSRQYRETAQRIAREEGAVFLDVRREVQQGPPQRREAMYDDEIHLTVFGHREVARLVAEGLRQAGLLSGPAALAPEPVPTRPQAPPPPAPGPPPGP